MSTADGERAPAVFMRPQRPRRRIIVYDCRSTEGVRTERCVDAAGWDYNDFLRAVNEMNKCGMFVLTTTDRTILDFDKFKKLEDGNAVYLLRSEDQVLPVSTMEHITFTPHPDTLTQSGMYEYYTSNSQDSLPYALAELIDNALSATVKNSGVRTIEIRMMFDEANGKPAVVFLDNGCGMTSKKLNNWAVYRLSKFTREDCKMASKQEGYVRPDPVPRSLNSDISYFGVGGKHAVFYIGDSVRMITKPVSSPDVHELMLSKEEFDRKEKNKEDVYSTFIRNRKPGDSKHVTGDNECFLHPLIAEETKKESFTAVVITGVRPELIGYLKDNFLMWTRQLAHVYHYYIHGANGNVNTGESLSSYHPNIDIVITLRDKSRRIPRVKNLREVDDDLQTLCINSAAETFEFRANIKQDSGSVEGLIRYHPFLYDRETYPRDPGAAQAGDDGDDDDGDSESRVLGQARGKRPIFVCFWNGRLIPYSTVSEFDWCEWTKESKVPKECYGRISGVLFTDDRFQVSNNKCSFLDLETKLRDKETIFTRVVNGQKQRINIKKDFAQWLQSCHEKHDKQMQFLGVKETITRKDLGKQQQHPWTTFSSIEWDGKTYRAGQLVKSHKTNPTLYGTVVQFLLFGDYKENVYATGGQVEISLEPQALHDKNKIIPISKIDKSAADAAIKKYIDSDLARLPDKLKVNWPEGNPWSQDAVQAAGTPLGPLKVEILNQKEESLSMMPSVGQKFGKKLNIELKVTKNNTKKSQELVYLSGKYAAKWAYWFKKIEDLKELGSYTLSLKTVISDTSDSAFGGRELPSYKLNFTIVGGNAETFVVGPVKSTHHVGMPFDIPLLIKDGYDHPAVPPPDLKAELKCSGLVLSHEKMDVSGTTLTIKGIRAKGKVLNYQQSKSHNLKVSLLGLKEPTQNLEIILFPGKPHSLHVSSEDDPITTENGNPFKFNVEVHDEAGNITPNAKQIVRCQVEGFPMVACDCSSTGAGQIVTKVVNLKIIKGEPHEMKAHFDMPSHKKIPAVVRELKVLPSTRVSRMELYSQDEESLVLRNREKIEWLAGGLLENLYFRLFDEAGRDVAITAEMASKIKVNWMAQGNLEDLVQGMLPDIQVSKQVHEERLYQVSFQDQNVSVFFHIIPRPDEPSHLRATLLDNTVRLGETLANIKLELVDQFGNLTKTLDAACESHIKVEAEGLAKSDVVFKWQASSHSILVSGIRFLSETTGSRELCFTYKGYEERVIIKVKPGLPAALKFISTPQTSLQVLNDRGIAEPFVVQLCDMWGNPSPDQRVVVELRCSPPTLKVTTAVTSQPVDAEGKASFTITSVSGSKGYYQLDFHGSFNKKPICGPSVNLTVIPDPNKPVSLSVEYDATAPLPAGGKFPVFSVKVMSDDGSTMTTFSPAAVTMFVWNNVTSGNTPPETATKLKCSKPMANETNHCFRFRDKDIPDLVGTYSVQFSLQVDKTKSLYSSQISVSVEANEPVRLGPDSPPQTRVVSYSRDIGSRTLVDNMTLRIMDAHGNLAGQKLGGKVKAFIRNEEDNKNKTLPLFEGKTSGAEFSLLEGKVHIKRLAIMENSPGMDGSLYVLVFQPEVQTISTPLAPYELQFHFLNDVENQQKISELTKKKDELTAAINGYKEFFNVSSELLQLLTDQHANARKKETDHRCVLMSRKLQVPSSIGDIDGLIDGKSSEAQKIMKTARRCCSLRDDFRGQQDVLGTVGHLALVRDHSDARVISWHIQGDMDCVITQTTEAAKRIYDDTRGRQQVMSLDSVLVDLGIRPMPHMRNSHRLFEPLGNPVFARDLLIFPHDPESCKKVFRNILGDTILIDDLDSANAYRRTVVQNRIPCPTILTRLGDRLSAKGKFGGAHNKAPPMNVLRVVFGEPHPQPYHELTEEIDLLVQYRTSLQELNKIGGELAEHQQKLNGLEMLKKQQEMEEKEKQLDMIQKQLSLTPQRPAAKRGAESFGEPSGIQMKRTRQQRSL